VHCRNSNDRAARPVWGDGFIAKIMLRRDAFFPEPAPNESFIEKQADGFDPHPFANYRAIIPNRRGRLRMTKPPAVHMMEYSSPKRA
jgi:hypothetical protein